MDAEREPHGERRAVILRSRQQAGHLARRSRLGVPRLLRAFQWQAAPEACILTLPCASSARHSPTTSTLPLPGPSRSTNWRKALTWWQCQAVALEEGAAWFVLENPQAGASNATEDPTAACGVWAGGPSRAYASEGRLSPDTCGAIRGRDRRRLGGRSIIAAYGSADEAAGWAPAPATAETVEGATFDHTSYADDTQPAGGRIHTWVRQRVRAATVPGTERNWRRGGVMFIPRLFAELRFRMADDTDPVAALLTRAYLPSGGGKLFWGPLEDGRSYPEVVAAGQRGESLPPSLARTLERLSQSERMPLHAIFEAQSQKRGRRREVRRRAPSSHHFATRDGRRHRQAIDQGVWARSPYNCSDARRVQLKHPGVFRCAWPVHLPPAPPWNVRSARSVGTHAQRTTHGTWALAAVAGPGISACRGASPETETYWASLTPERSMGRPSSSEG